MYAKYPSDPAFRLSHPSISHPPIFSSCPGPACVSLSLYSWPHSNLPATVNWAGANDIDPVCGPSEVAYVSVLDLLACYHALNAMGDSLCEARSVRKDVCYTTQAHVYVQEIQTGADFVRST
jgi:hypothetical protein